MRLAKRCLLLAALVSAPLGTLAPLGAPAAHAGPNVPLCLAIANNYNACLLQYQQRGRGWGGGGWHGHDGGYGQDYGGGYGDGGWDGDDDAYQYYRQERRAARAARAQQACAPFLIQMQMNHCM